MANTKDINAYTGRTIDILAFDGKFDDSVFKLSQNLHDKNNNSGKVCTGIQKLAQRWLIEFLTPIGSIPYMPSRGSDFIRKARTGIIRNEGDLTTAFNFAKETVATNLRIEDSGGVYPKDEMYGDVSLLSVSVKIGDKLSLSVRLISLDGNFRKFIMPISINPAR